MKKMNDQMGNKPGEQHKIRRLRHEHLTFSPGQPTCSSSFHALSGKEQSKEFPPLDQALQGAGNVT